MSFCVEIAIIKLKLNNLNFPVITMYVTGVMPLAHTGATDVGILICSKCHLMQHG